MLRFSVWVGVCLVAAAVGTPAQAELRCFHVPLPGQPAPDPSPWIDGGIDLNFDGQADVAWDWRALQTMDVPPSGAASWTWLVGRGGSRLQVQDGSAVALGLGAAVGAAPPAGQDWSDRGLVYYHHYNPSDWSLPHERSGPWATTTCGAFGVAVSAADGVHYGWLYYGGRPVDDGGMFASNGSGGLQILGWAYETTPGVAATVTIVPEPAALALLAPLGVALGVRRGRRRTEAGAPPAC